MALSLVVAGILVLLPIAAAWYGEDWLRNNGAENAVIEDIDLNLFTGVARVTGLQAGGADDARLHVGSLEVQVRWWPLVSKRAHVEALRLNDTQVDVRAGDDGTWHIGALAINPIGADSKPAQVEAVAEDSPPWGFGSDVVHLTNVTLTYRDQLLDSAVDIHQITLGSHYTWEAGRNTELEVDMVVDGSPLRLSSDIQPWAEDRSITGSLKLDTLNLKDYGTLLMDLADLDNPRGTFSFDFELQASYMADGILELIISGPFEVDKVGFEVDGMRIENDVLRWDGEVRIDLPAPAGGSLLAVDGSLELQGAQVDLPDPAVSAAIGNFQWQGNVRLAPPADASKPYRIHTSSDVSAVGIASRHRGLDMLLAGVERLRLSRLNVNGIDQIAVDNIELDDLRLLDGPATNQEADVFRLQQASIEQLSYSGTEGVRAVKVGLQAPVATVTRNADGTFAGIEQVLAAFTTLPTTEPSDDTASASDNDETNLATEQNAAVPFLINRLEVRGEQWFSFNDLAADPPVRFDLSTLSLDLDNIDSRGAAPANLQFETGVDTLLISAAGTVDAFAEAMGVDLTIDVANLDLPTLSPYVPGYNIERGRFSTNSTLNISGDALEMNNALLVERLKLAAKSAEDSELMAEGLAMPLDVALDLLRDRNDRIMLDLPVSGSLSDPQFDTGDIMRIAMQNALQSAAMTYVKSALQPLGTILLVSNLARKSARPRFAPVAMNPGEAMLPTDGRGYLDKIGSLLNERPGLQLTMCGVAAPADRQALLTVKLEAQQAEQAELAQMQNTASAAIDDFPATGNELTTTTPPPAVSEAELVALAQARTTEALNYLTESVGIERSRLFACRANFVDGEDALPEIEISL